VKKETPLPLTCIEKARQEHIHTHTHIAILNVSFLT